MRQGGKTADLLDRMMWKDSNQEGLFIEMGTNIMHKRNLTIFRQIIIFFILFLSHQTEKLGGFIFYDMLDF